MSRMPERIWAWTYPAGDSVGQWDDQSFPNEGRGDDGLEDETEYIRADIYAKELTALAIESKDRELVLARLEAEVIAMKKEWEQKNR